MENPFDIPETSLNKPITIGRNLAEYAKERSQREIKEYYQAKKAGEEQQKQNK